MSYLQDKRKKNKRLLVTTFAALFIFILFYFSSSFYKKVGYVFHSTFRPIVLAGQNIGTRLANLRIVFISKKDLLAENQELKNNLLSNEARVANYNALLDENLKLRESLGRLPEGEFILGEILSKPNQSLYDTLVVDIGEAGGVEPESLVFAFGETPIGKVSEVFPRSAKISLFSTPQEKTQVIIVGSDTYMEIVGRGGGNFEMILPRDFSVIEGSDVVLPGVSARAVARVVKIISDPRDSYKKALLKSPVNIQNLKFVEIKN